LAPLALQLGFTLGRHGAEGYPPAFFIHAGDPSRHHIAHLHRFVQIFDEPVRHFADVDQTTAIGGQLDKDTKRHHAHDYADDLIPRLQ
jgi:hypothetical protein